MHKIMLVEDDDLMRSLLADYLSMEGFPVVQCDMCGGIEATLAFLEQEQPALAVVDVHSRQIDGFELLHSIRSSARLQSLRVLMTSGLDFVLRSYQEGADGFLLKPYMPEELVRKINDLI
jgi:DNA-binding response OmpR family regulator